METLWQKASVWCCGLPKQPQSKVLVRRCGPPKTSCLHEMSVWRCGLPMQRQPRPPALRPTGSNSSAKKEVSNQEVIYLSGPRDEWPEPSDDEAPVATVQNDSEHFLADTTANRQTIAYQHGLLWGNIVGDSRYSICDAIRHHRPPLKLFCVKEYLAALHDGKTPAGRQVHALVEKFVFLMLFIDLQAYARRGAGVYKPCLSKKKLTKLAEAFLTTRGTSATSKERRTWSVAMKPYTELWEFVKLEKLVLAHVHARLQQWRLKIYHEKHCQSKKACLCGARLPFGGVKVVLAGDFGQLPSCCCYARKNPVECQSQSRWTGSPRSESWFAFVPSHPRCFSFAPHSPPSWSIGVQRVFASSTRCCSYERRRCSVEDPRLDRCVSVHLKCGGKEIVRAGRGALAL